MERLQEQGWYLTEQGYDLLTDSGSITDPQKIIKRALDLDLREISSGNGDVANGNVVLQIQKLRNVAAAKSNEESRSAPRMLKLSLTDGKNNHQAVEIEQLQGISLNTPPGTKILLKKGGILTSHGIILLKGSNIASVLGGKVPALIEKWELNRKLASHTRVRSADEGGPPPWIPFGKKIVKVNENDRNFKALGEKDAPGKDNSEFEAQRQAAVAEAAKQGSKKVFGGGTKQLLDFGVQKIVDQGFTIDQAEYALKVNRNNVDRALKSLQKNDNRKNNVRETREPREPRGKRNDKKGEETKPSSGKVSLFDFLEDKLPAQENAESAAPSFTETYTSRLDNHVESSHSTRGRGQKPGRGGYQAPPRHSDDSKFPKRNNENFNSTNPHQNRPPRFQKSQDHQFSDHNSKPSYGNRNQTDRRNAHDSNYSKTYRNQNQGSESSRFNESNRFNSSENRFNSGENENFSRHESQGYSRGRQEHRGYNQEPKNFKNQGRYDNSRNHENNRHEHSPWVWKIGDQCMAKYWEDNQYYDAEVTAVSARTCVVQFKKFNNYEEVLQIDCIPISEDIAPTFSDNSRPNRRHDNFNPSGMEFRRGGGGSGANGNKGFRKRGSQRSTQPIYQPPAQRSTRDNPKI